MRPDPIPESALIEISSIYTFYHFQFATGYVFKGENHPFWEMVYVINGQVDIGADDQVHVLGGGDVIFHRPDEFHSIWANYAHAPELIVVSFESASETMRQFEKKCFRVSEKQQRLLRSLLQEAERAFSTSLESGPRRVNPDHPGGSYMIRLILTQLLMDMLTGVWGMDAPTAERIRKPDLDTARQLDSLAAYMRGHLRGGLRFADLCRHAGMSETVLKQLFRRYFGASPMAYYEQIRMGEARRMLREGDGNVASVAYALGFSSPAYFSTRFKNVCGMSPREYVREER